MHELAKITGIRSDIEGTEMKVFVPEKNLFNTILDKRIRDVELRLDDGRTITNAQRKKGIRNDQRHCRLYRLSSRADERDYEV
mgnify:CR=1 FL=1